MSSPDAVRRVGLDAERITKAALEIADAVGLDGLSMRRVAERVGVPVMTLYGHVRTKDELLDRMAELALHELELPPPDRPWDEQLELLFRSLRAAYLRHPGVARLFADRAVSGTSAHRSADAALRALRSAGFGPREAVAAFTALLTYTLGATLFTIARSPEAAGEAEHRRLERLSTVSAEELPALAEAREHMQVRGGEEQFEYGLRHLIDGLRRDAAG